MSSVPNRPTGEIEFVLRGDIWAMMVCRRRKGRAARGFSPVEVMLPSRVNVARRVGLLEL